ncbi:Fasciclin-like arabinogalactan protein 11 [Glycine soja]
MAKLIHFLLFLFIQTISAQTPAAPAGPTNITQVLEKAGQFTTFIKLLKASQIADRINSQLNNSNQGLTVFAPTDNAFSSLKAGTLNSINSQDQMQLIQFHILPTLYTISQFQTASNPLHTQAGNSDDGEYPLNVTTSGNQVNVTTGVVDTTVSNTIYSDTQLSVYQVDKVLLPMKLFGATAPAAAPAEAPAPSKPEKNVRAGAADASSGSSGSSVDASNAVSLNRKTVKGTPMTKLFNFLPFLFLNIFIQTISAQVAPAPAGPTNITQVLEKAGQFTTFIKLLKASQIADRINSQLNNSNQGLTVFAPTDNAFSSLKAGTLNSINSQDQMQLIQFHILPTLYTISQFQTASNPLHTQAGNSDDGEYPLNVTTSGNQVNVTTGVVDTTVSNTIYSDNQLAVYQVDKVLLPMKLFGAMAPAASPAEAPAPTKPEKNVRAGAADSPSGSDTSADASSAVSLKRHMVEGVTFVVAVVAMVVSCF